MKNQRHPADLLFDTIRRTMPRHHNSCWRYGNHILVVKDIVAILDGEWLGSPPENLKGFNNKKNYRYFHRLRGLIEDRGSVLDKFLTESDGKEDETT